MTEATERPAGATNQHAADCTREAVRCPRLPYPLLKDVSRSFYLTLRVLPSRIRPQIGLAYLLARATDTIADTEVVAVEKRLEALHALRQRILGQDHSALDFGELAPHQVLPAEGLLLGRCEELLATLAAFGEMDRQLVRDVLATIISGQELDLTRFGAASPKHPTALKTGEDLDDYTYRVAGCVGEFWTRICRRHLFPKDPVDELGLVSLGIRFGKGLQLVNILRDLPADLRRGRCYLPLQELLSLGIGPGDLLELENESRVRRLYNAWLSTAEGHLRAGWDYTNLLPDRCVRLRLACAWPVLIGLETIELLKTGKFLDGASRIKVSRRRVKQLMVRSVLLLPWKARWRGMVKAPS